MDQDILAELKMIASLIQRVVDSNRHMEQMLENAIQAYSQSKSQQ